MRAPLLALIALPVAGLVTFVAIEAQRTALAVRRAAVPSSDDAAVARGGDSVSVPARGDGRAGIGHAALGPPASDPDDVRRQIALSGSGTYLSSILRLQDSLLIRWPDRSRDPIRVWVEPRSAIVGFRTAFVDDARQAFTEWAAAEAPLRFVFVADSADSEVRVRWIERFADGERIGSTLQVRDASGWIVSGTIRIAMETPGGRLLDDTRVQATAVHEVGHLLGLNHSDDTSTIMAPAAHATRLSGVDIATLRLLYALPPGSIKIGPRTTAGAAR